MCLKLTVLTLKRSQSPQQVKIRSKLCIKRRDQCANCHTEYIQSLQKRHKKNLKWHYSGVFIISFEQI